MRVDRLDFENFRNLKTHYIEPDSRVNVIYGDNAQGKTNLLEAIWLFCGGHSFRGAKEKEMIGFDWNFFRLQMEFFSKEREQNAEIGFAQNKKSVKLNGVEKSSSSYLTEVFCAVVFSPEHLTLIKRGPAVRRRFIDGAICQHRIRYATLLSKYNQIINQRNALLKDIYRNSAMRDMLAVWDEALIAAGARIVRERLDYLQMIREYAAGFHRGISADSEELGIEYISTCFVKEQDSIEDIEKKLAQAYKDSRDEDCRMGNTSIGPHRDDLEITINGLSARKFASQGQQRSAVLSLKLSEAEMLSVKHEEKPVILLDDVLSELDPKRQDFLLNRVDGYQVFVTCCEESNKEQLAQGKVFYIQNGEVR